ncbi:hypothetical protein ACVWZV_003760 [Bradyrhizobium sp. GM5.1]
MLARLSIRDIVLIERLDIEFAPGLAVLTGETGAGKSILLDALCVGARRPRRCRPRAAWGGAGAGHCRIRYPKKPSRGQNPRGERAGRYRRDDSPPGPARRRPHPRLHQRPGDQRADAEGGRGCPGRDPRPARRARAGRCRHPPPPARRLRRSRKGRLGGRGALGRTPHRQHRAGGASRRHGARRARSRLPPPRLRRIEAARAQGRRGGPRWPPVGPR